jgi:D-3-phosphoglycerate dehydrogenase
MTETALPWRLAALVPIPAEAVRGFVPDPAVQIVVPADRTPEAARAAAAEADVLLGDWTGLLAVDGDLLAAAPHVAFVQQPSVGVEHIDLDACAAAGIPVANAAGANAVSVAEWCVAAALELSRSMVWADAEVRAGRWPQLELVERGCVDLAGRRVGLVGFGPIGLAAAERFAAFGCPVAYWSRRRRDAAEAGAATYADLPDLVATSDVLVVVVALAAGTRGLLGRDLLATLPRGAHVVNAARGGIVDEDALADLLDGGQLGGAAFDVFATEPLPPGSRLRVSPKVLLSPHVAGATVQSRLRILSAVTANIQRAIAGEPVQDVLNGVDPVIRRRR